MKAMVYLPQHTDKKFYIKAKNYMHIEDVNIRTVTSHRELDKIPWTMPKCSVDIPYAVC